MPPERSAPSISKVLAGPSRFLAAMYARPYCEVIWRAACAAVASLTAAQLDRIKRATEPAARLEITDG